MTDPAFYRKISAARICVKITREVQRDATQSEQRVSIAVSTLMQSPLVGEPSHVESEPVCSTVQDSLAVPPPFPDAVEITNVGNREGMRREAEI